MATLTLAEISVEMAKELGSPSANVELDDATIQKQWLKALDIFNDKVGLPVLESLSVTANTQSYDLTSVLASAPVVRKVLDLYTPDTYNDAFNTSLLETPDVVYDPEAIVIEQLRKSWNSKSVHTRFAVIEPMTLMIIPAPTKDDTYKILVQKEYDVSTIPDKYERIVRNKAISLCLMIIFNSRTRLATPMRNGDYIKYSNTNKYGFELSSKLDTQFEEDCYRLVSNRVI